MSFVAAQERFPTPCSICLDQIEFQNVANDNIVMPCTSLFNYSSCGHLFHRECIEPWIDVRPWFSIATCPNCRAHTYSLITLRQSELVSPSLQQESWYDYFCSFLPDLSSIFGSSDTETEDIYIEDPNFYLDLCFAICLIAAVASFFLHVLEFMCEHFFGVTFILV